MPDSASTWCAESTVPSASFGSSSDISRSSPSSSENSRRQPVEGCLALGSSASSASASSSARRRGVPGASATAGSSPSCRKRSRTNFSARAISAELGMVVAARATEVDSAIEGSGLRDRAAGKVTSTRLEGNCARVAHQPETLCAPAFYVSSGYSTAGREPRLPAGGEDGCTSARALGAVRDAPSARLCRVTPTRLALLAVTAGIAALLIVGLLELGGGSGGQPSRLTPAEMQARLRGSPPQLAALHARAAQLLPGGLGALRGRLAALRGTPVVINKWASWCEPCRAEFGAFQQVSVRRGREVAFVGIDSGDASKGARRVVPALVPRPLPELLRRERAGRRCDHRLELHAGHRVHRPARGACTSTRAPIPTPPSSNVTSGATRWGPEPMPELRIDPLSRAPHDRRRRAQPAPGRRAALRARRADRPRAGPVRGGPRGPHAAGALRGAPGRRAAGLPGLDGAGRARTSTPRSKPSGRRARLPRSKPSRRRAGAAPRSCS